MHLSNKKLRNIANQVLALESEYRALSDEDLKAKTVIFREKLSNGATLDSILVDAFATVREVTHRLQGIDLYPEQIMGAVVLNQGDIAELKTGEGKTNTATMAVYLNALQGDGVHVITVNDYLAERDAEWMGEIYKFLGLTVGVNKNDISKEAKKEAFACDITYTTHAELGFDYLRDNMVMSASDRVLRGLHTAFIDEADSVLIDEARTPLVISSGGQKSDNLALDADKFVKTLLAPEYEYDKFEQKKVCVKGDYWKEDKSEAVLLTESGQRRAEGYFNIPNLYSEEHTQLVHAITNALKANYGMKNGVEYIVGDDKTIKLVDAFTGRIMGSRHYSDGLHQAIEAKEGVPITAETATQATITYQNLFRLYDKLAGMTGTAKTEEEEFIVTYNMRVIVIPSHKPCIRDDKIDRMFATKEAKYNAIVEEVQKLHELGRPVLIGTPSVKVSEDLDKKLNKVGLKHEVLNAKNHAREAEIIKNAGVENAITIATNMAGRGTDIKLTAKAKNAGGLAVIGAERHEARRIDNQLRGRAGRQGDPGSSQFFISCEDNILVRFGQQNLKDRLFSKEDIDKPLPDWYVKVYSPAITSAQMLVEAMNFDQRKHVMEYDDVLRRQREIIYAERNRLLDNDDVHEFVHKVFNDALEEVIIASSDKKLDYDYLVTNMKALGIPEDRLPAKDEFEGKKLKDCLTILQDHIWHYYEEWYHLEDEVSSNKSFETYKVLRIIDTNWINHIDDLTKLRHSISLRSYGQEHPLQQYVEEAYTMFENMNDNINLDIVKHFMKRVA